MRMSKEALQKLIEREVKTFRAHPAVQKRLKLKEATVVQEDQSSELVDVRPSRAGALYKIDAHELLDFAKAYRDLGDAVTEQLDTILDGNERDFPDQTNSNAIEIIEDELRGMNEEIDDALEAYNNWWKSKGKMGDEGEEDVEDNGT